MPSKKLIIIVFTLGVQVLFAQEQQMALLPAQAIFKEFQDDMNFLNSKTNEIEKMTDKLDTISLQKTHEKSIECNKNTQKSVQEFTDFNAKNLIDIDNYLKGNQPIHGSEMVYLNKSFGVYKQYNVLYSSLQDKSNNDFEGVAKINQLSSFYKNYYKVIENRRLRRVLNASDDTYDTKDNDLRKIAIRNLKRKNFKSIKRKIKHFPDTFMSTVEVDTSIYYQIKNNTYWESRIRKDKRKIRWLFYQDNSHRVGHFFMHHVSGFIGNFIGLFRFRKGYLYKSDSIYNEIHVRLKPMDIVTEKTGFALTDKLIPGHFGHIAIWLGTEKQLKENKLWNHPVIKPIQNRIRLGYSVLETDRKGTHLKMLKDFINVDEFAIANIIGFSELSIDEKVILYENALSQIGKGYDFNFDVETSNKLVCSELLYQVFGSIHWPTDSYLKRKTISPDNVLSLIFYQNTPISLSYYVGARSRKNIQLKTKEQLAKDLGLTKKKNKYYLSEEQCILDDKDTQKSPKKKCKMIYHELIYQ